MKLAIRVLALSIVFAGAAAAATHSSSTHVLASHQSATSAFPIPGCGPGMPTCPPSNPPSK